MKLLHRVSLLCQGRINLSLEMGLTTRSTFFHAPLFHRQFTMLSVLRPDATLVILTATRELFICDEALIGQLLLLERLLMNMCRVIGQMTRYGVIVVDTCQKDKILSLRKSSGRP